MTHATVVQCAIEGLVRVITSRGLAASIINCLIGAPQYAVVPSYIGCKSSHTVRRTAKRRFDRARTQVHCQKKPVSSLEWSPAGVQSRKNERLESRWRPNPYLASLLFSEVSVD